MEGEHSKRTNMTAVITPKKIPHSHPHHFQHQIFTIQHPALSSPILSSTMVVFFAISASDSTDAWERLFRWVRPVSTKLKKTLHDIIIPWLSHDYPMIIPLLSIMIHCFFPVLVRRRYAGRDLPWLWAGENPSAVAYQSNRPDGGPVGDWNQMQNRQTLEFYMCICIGKDCKRNFGML